jgi:sugar phosphate isomerase/epimerase
MTSPLIGVTLFSFTNEWQQRVFTLDTLLEAVAANGLGPGIELVGFQSIRGYPALSDEFVEHFKAKLAALDLVPTALAGNADIGIRRDRVQTVDEAVAYLEPQIVAARRLGFDVLRIQAAAGAEVLERLVPAAEREEVQVACELHAPLVPDHPVVARLIEAIDRIGSPFLGFVPDFSCSMRSVPAGYWRNLAAQGVPGPAIETARTLWASDLDTGAKFGELRAVAGGYHLGPEAMGSLNLVMTMFGRMPVDRWRVVLPYAQHIHGKFYEVDERGVEPSIPYPEIVSLLTETGYEGSISAEWEGAAFTDEPVAFEQVARWRAMFAGLLDGAPGGTSIG